MITLFTYTLFIQFISPTLSFSSVELSAKLHFIFSYYCLYSLCFHTTLYSSPLRNAAHTWFLSRIHTRNATKYFLRQKLMPFSLSLNSLCVPWMTLDIGFSCLCLWSSETPGMYQHVQGTRFWGDNPPAFHAYEESTLTTINIPLVHNTHMEKWSY